MRLGLLINSFGLVASLTVQSYGATLDGGERWAGEPFSALRQYLETISQHTVLRGHTFDYRLARISDSGTADMPSLDTVLEGIRAEIKEAENFSDLRLILSENYITDIGFKKLVDFLIAKSNEDLLDAISSIDLSNNRISASSANDVKKLLEYAPKLQLDLSINPIAPRDLDSKISGRVSCRAY
jgi:hypothetical protein